MAKFMKPESALARVVEDEKAPIMARYRALQELLHPPLNLLRRLLVQTSKREPVPPRIRALAALKYAAEMKAQDIRRERRRLEKKNDCSTNALGI